MVVSSTHLDVTVAINPSVRAVALNAAWHVPSETRDTVEGASNYADAAWAFRLKN
jgi:hypothetical protein